MAEITNEEANDLADDILGRSEFIDAAEPGFLERTVNRVTEFIGDILADIFEAIFGGAGGAAGQGIAIVLLILAAALLLFAIYRAVSNRTPKEAEVETQARVVFDEVVEPEQLQADMDRFIAAGDWHQAVVSGFRLSIVELIDRNLARDISGATTGDFAQVLAVNGLDLLAAYQPAASAFERAFYSDLAIDETDNEKVQTLLGQIRGVGAKAVIA